MALLVEHHNRVAKRAGEPAVQNRLRSIRLSLWGRPVPVHLAALVAFSLLVAACLPAHAQKRSFKNLEVKAVFLFNFAQFVEWPPEAFSDSQSPIVIGVLGEDPFGYLLDEAVRGEVVKNRRLVVERYHRVEEIRISHILFISPSESEKYEQIFATLQGRAILTVGDNDSFMRQGGMVRFLTEEKRIRLRVNLAAEQAARLTISSALLRQAEIVDAKKGQ